MPEGRFTQGRGGLAGSQTGPSPGSYAGDQLQFFDPAAMWDALMRMKKPEPEREPFQFSGPMRSTAGEQQVGIGGDPQTSQAIRNYQAWKDHFDKQSWRTLSRSGEGAMGQQEWRNVPIAAHMMGNPVPPNPWIGMYEEAAGIPADPSGTEDARNKKAKRDQSRRTGGGGAHPTQTQQMGSAAMGQG